MSALPIRHNTDTLAIFTESGSGKKVSLTEFPAQKRAGASSILRIACNAGYEQTLSS